LLDIVGEANRQQLALPHSFTAAVAEAS